MSLTGSDLIEAHLRAMTFGFASSEVVWQGQTVRGLLDREEVIVQDATGLVHTDRRTLRLQAAALTGTPAAEDALTVDGTAYKVRTVLPQGDGKELLLEVATSG